MSRALGIERIALLRNNPDKLRQLTALGVEIVEQVPTAVHVSATNAKYLAAKLRRGHTVNGFSDATTERWRATEAGTTRFGGPREFGPRSP
jgi:hypothetical protein